MRVYALSTDAWPTDPPANADLLLRTASRVVDELLIGRVYDVDSDGLPTDTDVAQALQDATVSIALELEATGVLAAGSSQAWNSVSIATVSLSGREPAEGSTVVLGLPVPAAAIVALVDVGTVWVCSE
jgi:hypothetical protein